MISRAGSEACVKVGHRPSAPGGVLQVPNAQQETCSFLKPWLRGRGGLPVRRGRSRKSIKELEVQFAHATLLIEFIR